MVSQAEFMAHTIANSITMQLMTDRVIAEDMNIDLSIDTIPWMTFALIVNKNIWNAVNKLYDKKPEEYKQALKASRFNKHYIMDILPNEHEHMFCKLLGIFSVDFNDVAISLIQSGYGSQYRYISKLKPANEDVYEKILLQVYEKYSISNKLSWYDHMINMILLSFLLQLWKSNNIKLNELIETDQKAFLKHVSDCFDFCTFKLSRQNNYFLSKGFDEIKVCDPQGSTNSSKKKKMKVEQVIELAENGKCNESFAYYMANNKGKYGSFVNEFAPNLTKAETTDLHMFLDLVIAPAIEKSNINIIYEEIIPMMVNYYKLIKLANKGKVEYRTMKTLYEKSGELITPLQSENKTLRMQLNEVTQRYKAEIGNDIHDKNQIIYLQKALNETDDLNRQLNKKVNLLKKQIAEHKEEKLELNALREVMFYANADFPDEAEDKMIYPGMDKLQCLKAVVIGGHQKWHTVMKQKYPNWRYHTTDHLNFNIELIKNADCVILNTNYMSHSMFKKVINVCRDYNIKVIYASGKNCEKQILEQV